MGRTALYAGSFDPLTTGHVNIIERASKMYDSLTVGVICNVSKNPLFTLDERLEIVREATAHLGNVEVDTFEGLLADYVNERDFDAVVRGLRNANDFQYELEMAQMNARLFTGKAETVFLMTDPACSYISSSLVREVASLNGDINGLVPDSLIKKIADKYSR